MPEKAVMLKDILQTEILYCKHIGESENDERDIKNFSVRDAKGKGLINYLKRSALSDERSGSMRTYIVRDTATDEMVGYFSLKAGLISYNEHDVPVLDEETEDKIHDSLTGKPVTRHVFDTLPGIEPANYAINHSYVHKNPAMKGAGSVIYQRFILPTARYVSGVIGVKTLYLFALPYKNLISRYEENGFLRLDRENKKKMHSRLKPMYAFLCSGCFEKRHFVFPTLHKSPKSYIISTK